MRFSNEFSENLMNRFKISTVLFLLILLMSGRVFSQTNYDFTAYQSSTVLFSGTFTESLSTPTKLTSLTNAYYEGMAIDLSTLSPGAHGYGYHPSSVVYGTFNGSDQTINAMNFSFANPYDTSQTIQVYYCRNSVTNSQCPYQASSPFTGYTLWANTSTGVLQGMSRDTYSINGTPFWDSAQGGIIGAPEIDGSLAPKVGFLLGCLFLMFGRKRSNLEGQLGKLMS